MYTINLVFLVAAFCFSYVWGHGLMVEPPNRSTLSEFYRVDNVKVVNNPNRGAVNCGGLEVQWNNFKGKCGLCGDVYDASHPQDNENTGKYGKFGSVRKYTSGGDIKIKINLTANHVGKFRYSLCVLDDPSKPESGEGCFKPLKLTDGKDEYAVRSEESIIENTVRLPAGLKCERCVLRWEYVAGNRDGKCDDGKTRKGCGRQDTFRNCADITIA